MPMKAFTACSPVGSSGRVLGPRHGLRSVTRIAPPTGLDPNHFDSVVHLEACWLLHTWLITVRIVHCVFTSLRPGAARRGIVDLYSVP